MRRVPTPPGSHNVGSSNVEAGAELVEEGGRKPFGEDVGELGACRNVLDTHFAKSHALADEMEVDLHMLRALVLHRVAGHVHGAHIVAVDDGCTCRRLMELAEELTKPGGLGNGVGDGAVLGFGDGAGDRVLPLRGLGEQVGTEEDAIPRGRSSSVGAPGPIGVRVCNKI